eukprot:gene61-4310_t
MELEKSKQKNQTKNEIIVSRIQLFKRLTQNDYAPAAKMGFAPSQNALGILYLKGEGTEKNINAASFWLSKAAEQNEKNAIQNLEILNRKKD